MIFQTYIAGRYFRLDHQPRSRGWRFWIYRMWYDGMPHTAIHLGPLIISWGWP